MNIILGGAGDDHLQGGNSRDLLIGGLGADRIVGNAQDDILIAGTTTHDAKYEALHSIMEEWTSANSYNIRLARLQGEIGGRNNGVYLKADAPDQTVFDDDAIDTLTGSAATDCFFANLETGIIDIITEAGSTEMSTDRPGSAS